MTTVALQVQFDPASARFGAARSQKRLEDDRLLAGKGLFSDDREFPDQAWLVVVRSPHAHAKILKVDLRMQGRRKGYRRVVDGRPARRRRRAYPVSARVQARRRLADGGSGRARRWRKTRCTTSVSPSSRWSRKAVTRRRTRRSLPSSSTKSFLGRRCGRRGRAERRSCGKRRRQRRRGSLLRRPERIDGLPGAAHVTRLELHNQRVIAMAMEPRACIGCSTEAHYALYAEPDPDRARELLGAVFKRKPEEFRVVNGDIGGGFGMKTGLTPEDALVCHAARKLGRPVRWRGERSEEFLAAHMGRDQRVKASLALDREGRILALRTEALANIGAVPVGSSAIIPLQLTPKVQTTVYRVPAVHYRVRRCSRTPWRPARTAAPAARGQLPHGAADGKGGARDEARSGRAARRNFIGPTNCRIARTSGRLRQRRLRAHARWRARRATGRAFQKKRGIEKARQAARTRRLGLSRMDRAIPTETVDIEVAADGTVTVFSGTQAMGQGLETAIRSSSTSCSGIRREKIRIVQGDTDLATGVGSVGSRSAFVGGSALVAAGRKMIARGRELAAEVLEAAASDIEFRDGRSHIAGTDRSIALADIAKRQYRKIVRVSATETPSTPSWPNGAQVVEVEVDPQTGEATLARIATCDDIGRIINHPIVEGQVHGGIAQGAGRRCSRRRSMTGQRTAPVGLAHGLLRAARDQFPPMRATFDETVPCRTNLLGVKGCGELGTIARRPRWCTPCSTRCTSAACCTSRCRSRRRRSGARFEPPNG
jgi:carbon-monoxide dehydrogenase large subunit